MDDLTEIETLLYEIADLREVHAGAPAVLKCLDEAEHKLFAAHDAAGDARRSLIDAANRLLQLARPPKPVVDDLDQELVSTFLAEAVEYLAEAESSVLRLEADPSDREAIDQIFRAFHTVKGTSAFLEFDAVTRLAHCSETLLSHVRDGNVGMTAPVASAVLTSIDELKLMIGEVRQTRRRPSFTANQDALQAELARLCVPGASDEPGRAPPRAPAATAGATPAAAATPPAAESSHADAEASVRVRIDRLDRLIDAVGELVIAQSMVAGDPVVETDAARNLSKKVNHAGKIVRELQDMAMSLRMVPLKAAFQKLARVVRDAAGKLGKDISFVTEGAETEVDRSMVDVITDPLVHMVRNACDHGIEDRATRIAAGKSPAGTLTLTARHSEGSVLVELTDDGKGLDRDRILARAIQRGLVQPDAELADSEVFRIIFLPGFSTTEQVTDMSGRGVGMDVVRKAVEALSGRIEIESTPGRGTTFRIRVPLTLAITDGLLVRVGDQRYIIPAINIAMSMRPTGEQLATIGGSGRVVSFRGSTIPVFRLADLSRAHLATDDATRGLLVVLSDGDNHGAVLVDEILGKQQVVTKALGDGIPAVRWIAGGAILGDGQVGLIVDTTNLLARFRAADPSGRAFLG